MHVAVVRLSLVVPGSRSLKDKRSALRRIKDRTLAKMRVMVAEVDTQDAWNHAVVGFAVVSGDAELAGRIADGVVDFVGRMGVVHIADEEREVFAFGDGGFHGDDEWTKGKFE